MTLKIPMTPHEFVELELKLIEQVFNVHKEVMPMFVLVKDEGHSLIEADFRNDAHKEMVVQGIRELVKRSEPDIVVYTAEAWAVEAKTYNPKVDPRPNKHPDRYEIVFARIEFKTGEKFDCEAKILREGDATQLDKFIVRPGENSIGRMVDFFPQQMH